MDPSIARQLSQTADLAHRLRRLSFFDHHFRNHLDALAEHCGLEVSIDPVRLTRAFLAWGEDFMRQRKAASIDRRDYIVFTAGRLLVRLLEAGPISIVGLSKQRQIDDAVHDVVDVWPEGFLCVEYCLTVLQAVIQQEFGEELRPSALAADLRVWCSFRENVHEDLATAAGFFDLFVGSEPNWECPAIATRRPAIANPGVRVAGLR